MKSRIATATLAAAGLTASIALSTAAQAAGAKVAMLLPDVDTTRYEQYDYPLFKKAVSKLCADCEVVYLNAGQDAAKQQDQMQSVIAQGVKAIVLDAVDSAQAVSSVAEAKAAGIPVIAYDRSIPNSAMSYYVGFDGTQVGVLQGQSLETATGGKSGDILMINGDPKGSLSGLFKKGAQSVLDTSSLKIRAEYDTPSWSPQAAQDWTEGQLAQGVGHLVGIYAANDGTASGAIAAMKNAGVKPLLPVTGQDAELPALQRIIVGDQYSTIYKAIVNEGDAAAAIAVALVKGETPKPKDSVDGVPATVLQSVIVTKENVKDTVIKDGFVKAAELCTADYAAACNALGIR